MSDPTDLERQEIEALRHLQSLVARAQKGDTSVLPELRTALKNSPETWQHFGDLSAHVQRAWIELLAGQNLCVSEGLTQKAADMRTELAGDDPSALEELLVERIIATWLQTQFYEAAIATTIEKAPRGHLSFLHRRLDSAHKRHIAAIRALTDIRRLLPEGDITGQCRQATIPMSRKTA